LQSPENEQLVINSPSRTVFRALGATTASDFPLRGMSPASGTPDVVIEAYRGPFPEGGTIVRELPGDTDGAPRARLYESEQGLLWRVTGVGTFWVDRSGRQVRYELHPGAPFIDVETLFWGPVLGLAARTRGETLLHGGAFEVEGRAAVISGAHGFGKSTFVAAAGRAGLPVLAEDVVHIGLGDTIRVEPFLPRLKLWEGSLSAIGAEHADLERVASWADKRLLCPEDWLTVARGSAPLGAVYFLEPRHAHEGAPLVRDVPVAEAVIRLHASMYLAETLAGDASKAALDASIAIAASVPVRTINYERSFEKLPEVRAAIAEDLHRA
jgi:hypothetical protein